VATPELSALDGLAGLKEVRATLDEWLAVVRAERARAGTGVRITRPAWKNLVFTGGPGTGKSHAARVIASAYHEMGFVKGGQVLEVAAAGMAGWSARETRQLVNEAAGRPMGRVLMITGAQAWLSMPDGGAAVMAALWVQGRHGRWPSSARASARSADSDLGVCFRPLRERNDNGHYHSHRLGH
jgi:ATPase family associated with various cellular activities (AAA)